MSKYDLSFEPDSKPKKSVKKREDTHKKSWLSYLQIPKRKVNEEYPFYFNTYNPLTDGIIFVITALLIPLVVLFLFHFLLGMGTESPKWVIGSVPDGQQKGSNDLSPLIYLAITIVSNVIGCIIFWQRDKELFLKSGFFVFYAFIFINNIVSFIVGIILGISVTGDYETRNRINQIVSVWAQVVAELIVIWLAFRNTTNLKKRVLTTIKENWLMLIIVSTIAAGLLFAFSSPIYTEIFKGVKDMTTSSANQNSLTDSLKSGTTGYKVAYAISLFVLTILVAPLTEELATRNAWFAGVGNKTFALITSAVFFGMLHVQSGDVEHILIYVIAGFVLASTFTVSRGNVTYDAFAHMIYNLISYIILLVSIF